MEYGAIDLTQYFPQAMPLSVEFLIQQLLSH